MKRIEMKCIVKDNCDTDELHFFIEKHWGGEVEMLDERQVPRDPDLVLDHSFDALLSDARMFANGLWAVFKGIIGISKYAIIIIVSSIAWLWRLAFQNAEPKQPAPSSELQQQKNSAKKR
jgi:hypothetical protein